jgi:Ca-activated chloride channel family protein
MDRPRDIRYRYNQGCAAFQNGDEQGASAAFSSVLRRAKEDEMRFKASYNLGNISFRQGDFSGAVDHFRHALMYDGSSEHARHNLEMALREMERQKKNKEQEQENDQRDEAHDRKMKEDSPRKKPEKQKEDEPPKDGSHQEDKKDSGARGDSGEQRSPQEAGKNTREPGESSPLESPRDLSGNLKPLHGAPSVKESATLQEERAAAMERKKAEALMDNIQEDLSGLLKYRIPEESKHGAPSGKDW